MRVSTFRSAPSAPMVAISAWRPVWAKAMRDPNGPRVPVNCWMMSFTHSSTIGRSAGPR